MFQIRASDGLEPENEPHVMIVYVSQKSPVPFEANFLIESNSTLVGFVGATHQHQTPSAFF